MSEKKRILLKLTGEAFISTTNSGLNPTLVNNLFSNKATSLRISLDW